MFINIRVNQQLDRCGDEFLNERDLEFKIDLMGDSAYLVCEFLGEENLIIKKADILTLANAIREPK